MFIFFNKFIFNTGLQVYTLYDMKNKLITVFALILISGQVFSQDSKFKLGLRFAPSLAMTRVIDVEEKDKMAFESNGAGVRFSAGLTGDFYFGKNYSFYTGLWYTTMRSGVKFTSTTDKGNFEGEAIYSLQYVQVPVAIKLFTNEIATDTKLYFVIGGTAGIKINEKDLTWDSNQPNDEVFSKPGKGTAYSFFDAGLLLTAGAEHQLGENTIIFGGLSYNRGLLGVQSDKGPFKSAAGSEASSIYTVSHHLLSLEFGLKF
jgi:hypothetical protein